METTKKIDELESNIVTKISRIIERWFLSLFVFCVCLFILLIAFIKSNNKDQLSFFESALKRFDQNVEKRVDIKKEGVLYDMYESILLFVKDFPKIEEKKESPSESLNKKVVFEEIVVECIVEGIRNGEEKCSMVLQVLNEENKKRKERYKFINKFKSNKTPSVIFWHWSSRSSDTTKFSNALSSLNVKPFILFGVTTNSKKCGSSSSSASYKGYSDYIEFRYYSLPDGTWSYLDRCKEVNKFDKLFDGLKKRIS